MYLFIVGGGEENKLSYIPSGQALMIGLKKSNTWWYVAAILGAPTVFVVGNFVRTEKERELSRCTRVYTWAVCGGAVCAVLQ